MKLLSTSIAAKAVLCILLSDPTDAQTRLRALSESMSMMTEYDVNYINSNPGGGYTSSSKAAKMAESWTGELPWTLWAPGGCDARDPMAVGATGTLISLTKIAPEALCEEDRIDTPNGTMSVFTKLTKVDCGSESAEFLLWDCEDKSCSKCDPAPELDGVIPNTVTKDIFYNTQACFTWYPKGATSFGSITDDLTSQTWESSVALTDVQAYYTLFYSTNCGESWLEENILKERTSGSAKSAKSKWAGWTAGSSKSAKSVEWAGWTIGSSKSAKKSVHTTPDLSGYWEISYFYRLKFGSNTPENLMPKLDGGELCHEIVSLGKGYYTYNITMGDGDTVPTDIVQTPDKNKLLGTNMLGALTFWVEDGGDTIQNVVQVPGPNGFLIENTWNRISEEQFQECILEDN